MSIMDAVLTDWELGLKITNGTDSCNGGGANGANHAAN
jgi:hypothetical protein